MRLRKILVPILGFAGAATVFFFATSALAGEKDLSKLAGKLLNQKSFTFAPSNVTIVTLDAILLEDLQPNTPTAMTWAASEKNLGRSVLVPRQFVDGSSNSNGLPQAVVAVSPTDAKDLLNSGLYIEWIP